MPTRLLVNSRQKQLHRTTTACHIMSLIRRQNPEARERLCRQRQHISSPSSTNDSSPILMEYSSEDEGEDLSAVASATPTEQSPNCSHEVINYSPPYAVEQQNKSELQSSGKNSSSFEYMSSWDTYWRQMSGPPPYKGKQNREIFQLVLKTGKNDNTETRYYVQEPLERDPHCLTSDQAQAMIRIAPNVYHGSLVADWTGLTSASIEEETVLTLAIPFLPKIAISRKEREYHSKQQMSTFIFFLFGYRHANVHQDYKKACPTDCNHEAHQLKEPKLPKLRFRVADLNSNLRFSDYSCIISSPVETLSFSSPDEERELRTTQYKGKSKKPSLKRHQYPQLALKITSVPKTNKREAAKNISSIIRDENETTEKPTDSNIVAKQKELSIGKGNASEETSQQW